MLANPKCSLLSNETVLSSTRIFSRAQDTWPKTFDEFRRKIFSSDREECLCIAGIEESDRRRVVLNYSRRMKAAILNFPSAASGFSQNELRIKEWLQRELI